MNLEFLLPGLALFGVTTALGFGRWPLPPRFAVRGLTAIAVVTASTAVILVAATASGFLLGPAQRAELVAWCRVLPLHHEVGLLAGALSLLALLVMAARVAIVVVRLRLAVKDTQGRRLSIIDNPEPMAYAAPGKPGCVVVSTGMLSALEPRERQVVFAHERAHLRQAHHRYVTMGALANALVPGLGPLVGQLRLATERCADEEVVRVLGGDRHLVASTIAKAAMTTSAFRDVVPAFDGASVVARVEALIGAPQAPWSSRFGTVIVSAGTIAALGAGSIQLHHLWVLADHICNG